MGANIMYDLTNQGLYSVLFMRRKQANQRGSPVRASLLWCLMEEVRVTTEDRYNQGLYTNERPLRAAVLNFLGKFKMTFKSLRFTKRKLR